MAEKKSFILYSDAEEQWSMLTDEQAGILIKALFRYADTGERLETTDGMLLMAFSFISAQIDRDKAKYKSTCEKRKEAVDARNEADSCATNVERTLEEV
ncbi:MAG: hypothetical protein J6X85_03180, partial [Ruminococcus sp.]|nr:hypothetical protein [Ruminococcus sp.]